MPSLKLNSMSSSQIRVFPVIGYQGAPYLVPPGNTLDSLSKAFDVGADMVDVTIRRTRDDVIVLYYDAVRKIDEREVPLRERDYSEWKQRTQDDGVEIATLDDVFALAARQNKGIKLDVREAGLENLLARAIRRSGFPLESLLVTMPDATMRSILRVLDPKIPLAHWHDPALPITAKLLTEIDTEAVTWNYRQLNPAIVKVLHLRGILVYTWTVDLAEDMRQMRDNCLVDGVITRAPDLLKSLPLTLARTT